LAAQLTHGIRFASQEGTLHFDMSDFAINKVQGIVSLDPVSSSSRPSSAAYYTSFDLGPYPSTPKGFNPRFCGCLNTSNLSIFLDKVLFDIAVDTGIF
jgi:hypothetical protein